MEEKQGLNIFLLYTIFAAVLGMFQFGYNTGVINAPAEDIKNFINMTYLDRNNEIMNPNSVVFLYSCAVAIFAIGGMIGGFSGGVVANKFGRKGGLLLNNILGLVGGCLMGFSKVCLAYEMILVGRFIIGINCGMNTSLVPMYISEIAPLHLRGALGAVNQLAVTIGLLLSQILGINEILGTASGWPLLLGIAVFPSLLQVIMLPVCPESPRYLLLDKNLEEDSKEALKKLYGESNVERQIEEMKTEQRDQERELNISIPELIRSSALRTPLIISIIMQLSQQLSGINAVFYYAVTIFKSAGLSEGTAKYFSIGIGVVMVVMVLITVPLMDRMGRRSLHLYGLGGMFIFSLVLTTSLANKDSATWLSYVSVASTLLYVVFFAIGPSSIPWLITAELFSQGPRSSAISIAVLVNWLANFLVGIGFPSMEAGMKAYVFLPFAALLALFWIFTYLKVPETKNKTFDEIQAIFESSTRRYDSMSNHQLVSRESSAL